MNMARSGHPVPAPASLTLLRERLPQISKDLARLFARDEDFRDLCGEYEACAATLARLDAKDPSLEPMRNEYRSLQLRLEGELLRYLEDRQPRPPS
jgi:hypothetical protein